MSSALHCVPSSSAPSRDRSPSRKGDRGPKKKAYGLFGKTFFLTVEAKFTMHRILAGLLGHPSLVAVVIGLEQYPTDPSRHHYHVYIQYSRRIQFPFSSLVTLFGAHGNLTAPKEAEGHRVCTYVLKNGHGTFFPSSLEPMVRRLCPLEIHVEHWTADQMKDMDDYSTVNGPHFQDHVQFWPAAPSELFDPTLAPPTTETFQ